MFHVRYIWLVNVNSLSWILVNVRNCYIRMLSSGGTFVHPWYTSTRFTIDAFSILSPLGLGSMFTAASFATMSNATATATFSIDRQDGTRRKTDRCLIHAHFKRRKVGGFPIGLQAWWEFCRLQGIEKKKKKELPSALAIWGSVWGKVQRSPASNPDQTSQL